MLKVLVELNRVSLTLQSFDKSRRNSSNLNKIEFPQNDVLNRKGTELT